MADKFLSDVTLARDPTSAMHAVTKQYFDARHPRKMTQGSNVGTPNASGILIVSLPASFFSVAPVVTATNGDVVAVANGIIHIDNGSTSASVAVFVCKVANTGAAVTTSIRINWVASQA
jgi:hypothetical protein